MDALAQIAHNLCLLGMEYRATKDANKGLAGGRLDTTLFCTYPLRGCYLLNRATLSDVIPITCFGTPGWKEYIESTKKNAFDEVVRQSVVFIDKSPWEIQGMPKRSLGSSGGLFSEVKRFGGMASPATGLADLTSVRKAENFLQSQSGGMGALPA
jgi:hypothetical protein